MKENKDRTKLTKRKFISYLTLPEEIDEEMQVKVGTVGNDFMRETITQLFQVDFWERELAIEEFAVPATWFQMFKGEVFPYWLLRRFPVIYKFKVLRFSEVFPHLHPSPLELGKSYLYVEDLTEFDAEFGEGVEDE